MIIYYYDIANFNSLQMSNFFQRSYSKHNITLPPEHTVTKILMGQPYFLENYRSKEDKLALLDAALYTLDSSTILAVVLFLQSTLKEKIFNQVDKKFIFSV